MSLLHSHLLLEHSLGYSLKNNAIWLVFFYSDSDSSGTNHNISTYPFLFIIRRFECYYTHCQETALN